MLIVLNVLSAGLPARATRQRRRLEQGPPLALCLPARARPVAGGREQLVPVPPVRDPDGGGRLAGPRIQQDVPVHAGPSAPLPSSRELFSVIAAMVSSSPSLSSLWYHSIDFYHSCRHTCSKLNLLRFI